MRNQNVRFPVPIRKCAHTHPCIKSAHIFNGRCENQKQIVLYINAVLISIICKASYIINSNKVTPKEVTSIRVRKCKIGEKGHSTYGPLVCNIGTLMSYAHFLLTAQLAWSYGTSSAYHQNRLGIPYTSISISTEIIH